MLILTWDQGTLFGRPAFVVNWVDVGYFASRDDLLNSFQLVLVDRSDLTSGDFDIEFNYGQIQWETGEASGGVDGLGGDSARVGYSNGEGNLFEFEGSSVNGALLDGGSNALVDITNVDIPGRFVTLVRNGEVVEIIVVTEEAVATIRDNVNSFASLTTGDINRRLLRLRTGLEEPYQEEVGYDIGQSSRPLLNLAVEVFGSYDFHSFSIDERKLLNAGGALVTSVPESELNMQVASAGLEVSISDSLKVGGAALFSKGDISHENNTLDADLDSQGFAGYATWYSDDFINQSDFYLDVLYANISGDITATRLNPTDYIGRNTNTGETDLDADELTLNTGLVFEKNFLRHGPYLQYSMKESSTDAYTEVGGSADTIPGLETESRKLEVGYQVNFKADTSLGAIRPHLRLAYEKEFEDQEITVNTLSLGAIPDKALVVGGGITYNAEGGMYASIDSEYRYIDSEASSMSVFLNLGFEFW